MSEPIQEWDDVCNKIIEEIDSLAKVELQEGTPEYKYQQTLIEAAKVYRNAKD